MYIYICISIDHIYILYRFIWSPRSTSHPAPSPHQAKLQHLGERPIAQGLDVSKFPTAVEVRARTPRTKAPFVVQHQTGECGDHFFWGGMFVCTYAYTNVNMYIYI